MTDSLLPDSPEPALPRRRGEYMVVARRYRPQAFDELVGQEHVGRALSNAITSNRVGHAYLFTGARGVGKTSAARILAKALNCQQGASPAPCNRCDICLSIAGGDDVDVLEIDGASNRGIDEIRQLRQTVSVRPSRSRFKIYIIDEVHMLTREAFNALLKTLEEPPEHVKFVFCTTEPEKIPITILSRCQRFDFAGIQSSSIAQRLTQIAAAEGVAVEPAAIDLLARRAAGSMRDSQSLLEQLLAFGGANITLADVHTLLGTADDRRIQGLLQHLVEANAAGALAEFDAALTAGVDVGRLLEQLLGTLRDVMVASVGGESESLLFTTPEGEDAVFAAAKQWRVGQALAITQILDQALGRLRFTTQGRIVAEMALVRICSLADLEDLRALVEELRGGAAAPAARTPLANRPAMPPARPTATPAITDDSKKNGPLNASGAGPTDAAPATMAAATMATVAPSEDAALLTPEQASQCWRQAVAQVSGLLQSSAAACQAVRLRGPRQLVAQFTANDSTSKSFCEKPPQLAKLEQALTAAAGQTVRLEFELVEGAAEPAARRATEPPRRTAAQRRDHPLVRQAAELFDANPAWLDEARRTDPPARDVE